MFPLISYFPQFTIFSLISISDGLSVFHFIFLETNYVEDVLAAGSFFHYAEGFSKPEAFDLTLPEINVVGKLKGML